MPSEPLSKNQKIAATSLAVFAVFILVLWFVQLRNNIYGPFNAPAGQNQVASEAQNSDEALKNKDTDSDGLSDWDELNVYKTSPYLEDSDGDGYKDGEEIKKNFDPNCPQGRTCTGGSLIEQEGGQASATASSTLNSLLNQFGATNPANLSNPTSGSANLNSSQLDALKNIDAASLRQLLLQNGMDKTTLDKISDANLLKSFQETLSGE
jgi:hypothetical protein